MNCFNASVIKIVYARQCKNFNPDYKYLHCPYCHELNKLPDSETGYLICGSCKQIFDVR